MCRRLPAATAAFLLSATLGAQTAGTGLPAWSFGATAYGYFVPQDQDYPSAIVTADRGAVHLEARYNYEDIDTGSVFFGWNFAFGRVLTLDLTPIFGGVYGAIDGVAPGYELTLSYKRFALYSESEYFIDVGDSSGNFFYTWAQLTFAPTPWLQAGLVAQRTKAYQTELDIQRGFLVQGSWRNLSLTVYVFNPGFADPTTAVSVGVTF
jgi:hypothetical protein